MAVSAERCHRSEHRIMLCAGGVTLLPIVANHVEATSDMCVCTVYTIIVIPLYTDKSTKSESTVKLLHLR